MSVLDEAAGVIRRAEDELRGLLARAAERAEYEHVQVLAGWARRLRSLLDEPGNTDELKDDEPLRNHIAAADGATTAKATVPSSDPVSETNNSHPPVRRKARRGSRSKKRSSRADYPKFIREGQNLVKIGWSKSDKAPYEHKAPRRVVNLVVEGLLRAGQGGRRFTTEGVLPLKDSEEGSEVPSYQTYLTLAWLRAEELVVQHGRQGYSLPARVDLAQATEERWQELPER